MLRFGYQFLGPFLVDWYNRLTIAAEGLPSDTIYMLGREGWGLVPLFNNIEALRGGDRRRFLYLSTSRALLTHVSLSDPRYAGFGFSARFSGTVRRFFESRLGVHFDLLDLPAIGDQHISLPRDRDYMLALFEKNRGVVEAFSHKSRAAYGRYLARSGFRQDATHILSDLGFRGTTQSLIAAIYGFDIKGFYAILDPAGVPEAPPLAAGSVAGLFSADKSFGQDYPPLDRSLLFEALLTAPFGQIIGIQDVEQGDPFLYREGGCAQRNYAIIAECIQGAHKFVLDNVDLLGGSEPLIEDFVLFFESYQGAMAADIDLFKPILEIDDSFYGVESLGAEDKL